MAVRSEARWLDLVDDFTAAALGLADWDHALRGLADATGSSRGQVIGVGNAGSVPFNWVTDFDAKGAEAIQAIDGHNERINPRVAAGRRSGVLQIVSEREYDAVRPLLARSGLYDDYAAEYDIPFGCQTNLVMDGTMLIGLAVLRTESDGRTTEAQREVFARLAPHVRAAVRSQILLEGQGASLIAGSLAAVSLAAFVCDGSGLVQAMTPAAEALLGAGGLLTLRDHRFGSTDREGLAALERAIGRAAAGPGLLPAAATVVLRGHDASPLAVDVLPLPRRRWSLAHDARLLVAPRGGRRPAGVAVLEIAYHLTGAEATIALALAAGHSRERIAADRGVSIGTVRTQLKSIFTKVGVMREVDLVARIGALL